MKINPSFRNRLLWYITGFCGSLIFLYTVMLTNYYFLGFDFNLKHTLEIDAKDYHQRYQKNPSAQRLYRAEQHAYRSLDEIPAPLLTLFPPETHKHRKMDMFSTDLFSDMPPNHIIHQLNDLCDGHLCEEIAFYSFHLGDGEWLYLVISLGEEDFDELQIEEFERNIFMILPLGASLILISMVLGYILLRNMAKPIHNMARWAETLELDSIRDEIPDFTYRELDSIAEKLHGAFERIAQTLHHEQQFLRTASHELRTPIAIVSANLDLLERASIKDLNATQKKAFERLKRASLTMRQLTETLLWLSRDAGSLPAAEVVDLHQLAVDLTEESHYLIDDKPISVDISASGAIVETPPILCRILLTNLIRNALQYTQQGTVKITVDASYFKIENYCPQLVESDTAAQSQERDYGFGLGLMLVQQIAEKMNWDYQLEQLEDWRASTIRFTPPSPPCYLAVTPQPLK